MWCVFGKDTNLHVRFDITINQPSGYTVTSIIRSAASKLTAKRLIVLVKEFAKSKSINKASKGTLSSIAYCFLCIYFLIRCKMLPKVFSGDKINSLSADERATRIADLLEAYESATLHFEAAVNPNLSDLMYSFFRFYSQDFDFEVYAVTLTHASPLRKEDHGWPHIDGDGRVISKNLVAILNPYGPENIGRTVSLTGMKEIKEAFRAAHEILLDGRAKSLFHKTTQTSSTKKRKAPET